MVGQVEGHAGGYYLQWAGQHGDWRFGQLTIMQYRAHPGLLMGGVGVGGRVGGGDGRRAMDVHMGLQYVVRRPV